jgi:pimeloyl-ACP methyl ester carboxylesterase
MRKFSIALVALIGLVAVGAAFKADGDRATGPLMIAKQGFFYAGGREIQEQNRQTLVDAMFVEYQIPAKVTAPYPIVMIHGQFQNGSNFLGTPDDREGWAEYFVRRGYPVYVIDQPARGRSSYNAPADGELTLAPVETIEHQFTAIEKYNLWPQARLHTQWPGTGVHGDPTFEQFRASQNPSMTDNAKMDAANRRAGAALLRRIGPAILLTHSRSGPFGWEIANDVPQLVKGLVAVEPNGPPFYGAVPAPAGAIARRWGVSDDQLTFDPPAKTAADLSPKREEKPQGKDLEACWIASVPHKLPRLAGIPMTIVTAEASYHARYDHCTSQFLTQAGVPNDFVPLAGRGIHGNGHMMMLEKNNLEIAGVIADWIARHVKGSQGLAKGITK